MLTGVFNVPTVDGEPDTGKMPAELSGGVRIVWLSYADAIQSVGDAVVRRDGGDPAE
jgi:hypothetical protein